MDTIARRRVRIVDRPALPSRSKYPIPELLRTLNTKKAVRVPLNGARSKTVIMSLHKAAWRNGCRLRYRQERTFLIAWVERRVEKTA